MRSIVARHSLYTMGIVFTIGLLLSLGTAAYRIFTETDRLETLMNQVLITTEGAASVALWSFDQATASALVERMIEIDPIRTARIVESGGRVMAEASRADGPAPASQDGWGAKLFPSLERLERQILPPVTAPTGRRDQAIGTLEIVLDRDRAAQVLLLSLEGSMLGVLLQALIVGVVIGISVNAYMVRPIKRLAEQAGDLETERGSTVALTVPRQHEQDEIGQLTNQINELLHKLTSANAALADAKETAEAGMQAKDRFLSVISHELRTPLHAIQGFCEVLLHQPGRNRTPLEQQEYLGYIADAGNTMQRRVEQILQFTRYTSHGSGPNWTEVDLTEVAEAAVATHGREAEDKGVTLSISTRDDGQPQDAVCDASMIISALCQLLSNAIKFSPRGGRVDIIVGSRDEEDDTFNLIDVTDTGPGLPPDIERRIAEPFATDGLKPRDFSHGIGIGLPLAAILLRQHDGALELSRREDGRTLARLRWPRREIKGRDADVPARQSGLARVPTPAD